MFERSNQDSQAVPASPTKKPSKWDKPKEPPPPPVNRRVEPEDEEDEVDYHQQEQGQESDLPEVAITRNLVAKFRELEQSTGDEPPPAELKPIRKMTPPREEIQQNVERYLQQEVERDPNVVRHDDQQEVEKELPPPEHTKNILQKWKSMESIEVAPPTPQQTVAIATSTKQKSPSQSAEVARQSATSYSEPPPVVNRHDSEDEQVEEPEADGGVFENEPVTSPDVVRESDTRVEDEFPEEGLTQNLLAQWRSKLAEAEAQVVAQSPSSNAPQQTWTYKQYYSKPVASEAVPVVRPLCRLRRCRWWGAEHRRTSRSWSVWEWARPPWRCRQRGWQKPRKTSCLHRS